MPDLLSSVASTKEITRGISSEEPPAPQIIDWRPREKYRLLNSTLHILVETARSIAGNNKKTRDRYIRFLGHWYHFVKSRRSQTPLLLSLQDWRRASSCGNVSWSSNLHSQTPVFSRQGPQSRPDPHRPLGLHDEKKAENQCVALGDDV